MRISSSIARIVIQSLLILTVSILMTSSISYEKKILEKNRKWSDWKHTDCYRYLKYRIKKMPSGAEWAIEFNNQYRKKVQCDVKIINGRGHDTLNLEATNTIIHHGYYTDDESIEFKLENVVFGKEKASLPCDSK